MTALVVLILLTQAPPAERVHVDWVVPEECPDPAQLTATLTEALPKDRTFRAAVRVDAPRQAGGFWRAVVTMTSADGQRRLRAVDAADCARVTEAAVLVMTLAATALPPEAVGESSPGVLPPAPTAVPPEEPLPPLAAEPDDTGRPPRALRLGLRLQGLFGGVVGVLPGPGFGAGIGVAFAFGKLRLEAAVFPWFDSERREPRGARFSVTSIRARAGWLFEPAEKWFLGPFAGAEVAFVEATGTGISQPLTATGRVVTPLAGVTFGRELSPLFRLFASLDAGLNVYRPAFVLETVNGDVDVHRTGLGMGRLTIGMELYLP
jgi:hypothetical protein